MNNFIARRILSGSVLLTAIASALNSHAQSALPTLPMTTQPLAPASRSVGQAPNPAAPELKVGESRAGSTSIVEKASPVAPSLEISNVFDSQRKVWPDRVPPPPPPPPPLPPTPVTDADLQLYGVVIVGQVKRATVKMGPRFANAATPGRAFANLVEGQLLGEFTVAEISPTYLTLSAPGGRQQVYFTKKSDRGAGNPVASAAPAQAPIQSATEPATSATETQQRTAGGVQATSGEAPSATGALIANAGRNQAPPVGETPASAPNGNGAASPPPVDIQNSLAAALAAARANASNRPSGPSSLNPFMQKP